MTTKDQDARLAYELRKGQRVSDVHWWRLKKLLQKHQLELSAKNVQLIADLREKVPRSGVGVSGLLEACKRADELVKKAKGTLKGSEIVKILRQFGITAHRTTISRWFGNSAGGYKKNREYQPEQIRDILIAAFIYKAQNSPKLPKAN